jgi:anti-anti-sigma factor
VLVVYPSPGTAVVRFTGEHDLVAREDLRALLDSLVEQNDLVVADFSDATFVDSTTMHALLDADTAARVRGRTFRLQLGTAAIVRRAFELSGILRRLDCVHSREEALGRENGEPGITNPIPAP